MPNARTELYKLVRQWERGSSDSRDFSSYTQVLEEILFHADLRFRDYIQYQSEGEFPVRLKTWIENVKNDKHKQYLLRLVSSIIFVDNRQMMSVYRDAYRRIIIPWICNNNLSPDEILSQDYEIKLRAFLKEYVPLSITESFSFPEFLHVNDLSGLIKPIILGEDKTYVEAKLASIDKSRFKGAIVFEDFVGTGNQAQKVLLEARRILPAKYRILFVPLIMLERNLQAFAKVARRANILTKPVMIISNRMCIMKQRQIGEPPEFKYIRAIINSSSRTVLERLNSHDDPPKDPFGYGSCGCLLVTCHNTPNNSIPLIHHRAPSWAPLFRRVHHSKDGLR